MSYLEVKQTIVRKGECYEDVMVLPVVLDKRGEYGDLEWMITQPEYEDALFLYPETYELRNTARRDLINTTTMYNPHGIRWEYPRSAGISNQSAFGLYRSLSEIGVKKSIDKAIVEIRQLIRCHHYKRIFYRQMQFNRGGEEIGDYINAVVQSLEKDTCKK